VELVVIVVVIGLPPTTNVVVELFVIVVVIGLPPTTNVVVELVELVEHMLMIIVIG
jgi:hypothetical protein